MGDRHLIDNDLIILGGGPADLTAGMCAARSLADVAKGKAEGG